MARPDPLDRRIRDVVDLLNRTGRRVDGQLVDFIRWYQLRPSGAPDAQEVDPGTGKWGAVGRATIVLGLAQAGMPAQAIMALYTALANVEDAQARMLKSVDKKATLLVDGPLRTAQLLLREAERIGLSDPRYASTLQRAWDRFFDAYGLADSPQSRAVVQMHLGQVSLLLGRREDAAHWLMESYRCAREAIEVLAAGSNDGRVLRTKWGTAASALYSPVGVAVLARKMSKIRRAQYSLHATRSYVDFVNAVAAGANSVSRHATAPGLVVEQVSANEFVIREVPLTFGSGPPALPPR